MLPCQRVPFDPSLRRCHIKFHNSRDELLQNRRRKLFHCSKLPLPHSGTLFELDLCHEVTFQVEMYIFVAIQAMACQDQGLNIVKIKTNWNNSSYNNRYFYIDTLTVILNKYFLPALGNCAA